MATLREIVEEEMEKRAKEYQGLELYVGGNVDEQVKFVIDVVTRFAKCGNDGMIVKLSDIMKGKVVLK